MKLYLLPRPPQGQGEPRKAGRLSLPRLSQLSHHAHVGMRWRSRVGRQGAGGRASACGSGCVLARVACDVELERHVLVRGVKSVECAQYVCLPDVTMGSLRAGHEVALDADWCGGGVIPQPCPQGVRSQQVVHSRRWSCCCRRRHGEGQCSGVGLIWWRSG
jgi:hypothetical protein|eukprot:COSAG01_NODE_1165_length_11446_cov_16.276196_14_plen_161_part_00